MLTETKESFLSLQPAQDVSGSKMYVLFGMKVTMLLSLVQFSTSFDLISLQKTNKQNCTLYILIVVIRKAVLANKLTVPQVYISTNLRKKQIFTVVSLRTLSCNNLKEHTIHATKT